MHSRHRGSDMSFQSPAEFYRRHRDNPSAAREAAFKMGQEMGRSLKLKNNIQGETLEAVAMILNATMRTVQGEETARVEGESERESHVA